MDSYTPDFERILEIASELEAVLPKKCRHASTLDMGIVSPVYFVALKCRHPSMRRRAVHTLRDCGIQEGAWNSRTMAALAESIMFVEERGLDSPQKAADVPEMNRLYRAWYDLTEAETRLYCKRRCFELEGRWIEYVAGLGPDSTQAARSSNGREAKLGLGGTYPPDR